MVDDHPGTLAFVQYHYYDDYVTPWSDQRALFYGVNYIIPTIYFDGTIAFTNAEEYATYDSAYESRRAIPTDVTIALDAVLSDPSTLSVSARVCLESTGLPKAVRMYIVQVLDHWPPEGGFHRNGFRQAAATEDVSLLPGQCQVTDRTFILDAGSAGDPGNIRVVAWAQAISESGPAEVYQAAIWAPGPVPDCNHNGIPDPADIASGTSTDLNHNGIPDECEGLGDMNCDGYTDFDDINPFVAALVSQANYEAAYPNCRWLNADCNGDGAVDFDDINPFVALLAHQ